MWIDSNSRTQHRGGIQWGFLRQGLDGLVGQTVKIEYHSRLFAKPDALVDLGVIKEMDGLMRPQEKFGVCEMDDFAGVACHADVWKPSKHFQI